MDQWEISIRKLLINGAITSFTEIFDFWGFLAFQNGTALENWVKIGGAMSKKVLSYMLTALECKNFNNQFWRFKKQKCS